MASYISVPEDLTKVKNKIFMNLTLRQIISILVFGGIGVGVFFLTRGFLGTTVALILLVAVVTPGFLFAAYERNGLNFEHILRNMLDVLYLRPQIRRYETRNYFRFAKVKKGTAAAQKAQPKKVKVPSVLSSGNGRKKKERKPNPLIGMKKIDHMTAQETIHYREMSKDGVCWVEGKTYSKTIRFFDITYQLAQSEDQASIFSSWCEFLNYFDNTVRIQISFVNHRAGMDEFRRSVQIEPRGDQFDPQRAEYSRILQEQLTKGNNGLVKSKYITYSVQADSYKEARQRLSRIEADILNNFKAMGVQAYPLNGTERLAVMYDTFNPDSAKFSFDFDNLIQSGLTTKDFIAPSSFTFKTGRYFTVGKMQGQVSFLQILASELSDTMLSDFLESENELVINMHIQSVEQQRAIKLVKQKLTDINRMKIEEQKKAARNGYDMNIIPTDLNLFADKAQDMLVDLQQRNERMFMVTILFLNTAETQEKLDAAVQQLKGIAQKHNCNLSPLDFMQERGLNASLPLGYSNVPIERGLTTTSTAIFVPFTTQELFMDEPESIYYGLNALSNNMIMANRKDLKNPNGLIFGTPGAGKSFAAKREILNVFFVTEDDIIICDPEGEYGPLVDTLGGQTIQISSTSKDYINPMDITMDYSDEDNPLSVKSDFILSMYELMSSDRTGVSPEEKSVLDRCLPKVYQKYFDDPRPENMPILGDLYNVLMEQEEPEARHIATILELYVNGSLNVFNHRTNVKLDRRVVCFDTKDLGKQLKKLGMLIVQDQVWNRVTQNRGTKKFTWYYIDEFHLLLKEEQTAAYSGEIWKRFRKWGGVPTGITQNVKDLLASKEIENIFENSDFILMLNQRGEDREILARHLNISPNQLSYVSNSGEGEGLVFYGDVIIPFRDRFDNQSSLYALMSTKPREAKQMIELHSDEHAENANEG